MNAVNLLPAKHRPKAPTGGMQGSAYVVVGILGSVLVMALLYVLTVNGINTRKDSVARAQAETTQAEKRVKDLAAYGNFSQVKEQRVSSVKQLASGRIDWERMALGLAHVLPADVWLTNATASSSGKAPGGAAPSGGSSDGGGKPSLTLSGCARDKQSVAIALVRLRELSGADDVQLANITQPESNQGSGAGTGGQAAGSGGSQDCGSTHGKLNFAWNATVVFKPTPGAAPADGKVPARLGGGQ